MEQHYKQIVDEEIDSVKKAFRRQARRSEPKEDLATDNRQADGANKAPAAKKGERKDYRAYYPESKKEPMKEERGKPYVISQEEFDTIPGYEAIGLKYFADGTVADDAYEEMSEEDIEEAITRENLISLDREDQDPLLCMRADHHGGQGGARAVQ